MTTTPQQKKGRPDNPGLPFFIWETMKTMNQLFLAGSEYINFCPFKMLSTDTIFPFM
jgi:hypothetical protein